MGDRGPDPLVSIDDILHIFREQSDLCEPLTATKVSTVLGLPKRSVLRYLNRAEEEGPLKSKSVGANAKVRWLSHDPE